MDKDRNDDSGAFLIQPPKVEWIRVPFFGVTPLLQHRFGESAIAQLETAQNKNAQKIQTKAKRDPEAEFREAMYTFPDGRIGHPASGFKQSIERAAKNIDGLTMTDTRTSIMVVGEGDLVPLNVSEPIRHSVPVTIGRGSRTMRYRPLYGKWSGELRIRFNPDLLSGKSIVSLVEHAGNIGVGDWRPEHRGTFGLFTVDGSGYEDWAPHLSATAAEGQA